jgi:hypothetical protein
MARFDFDPNDYKDEVNNFQPIPKGEYKLQALEAEEFDTKKGDGTLLKVKFEVVDGPYTRRKIFMNFNVNNPSDQAQRIGRGQIYAWRLACNKPDAEDTDQLLEIPFIGFVDIEERPGYSDQNKIKRFFDPNEAAKRATAAGAYDQPTSKEPDLPLTGGKPAEARRVEGGSGPKPGHRGAGDKRPWDDDIPFAPEI